MAYSNNAQVELTGQSAVLEERLIPITAELNEKSLRVNRETWRANLQEAEEDAGCLIDYCRLLTGGDEFRPNSVADCARVLFTDRGLKPRKISRKSGKPLADKDTLTELANEGDKLAGLIGEGRSALSRRSQLRAWKQYAEIGWVQPNWNSMGTPHGRYTADAPCLCNRIPPIRETIEPDPGYSFLSLDLSQAEYVTWASLSGDLVLGEAFLQGRDFHLETAQEIKALVPSWDLRGKEERDAGKTLNFAILYQMQPITLARKLGCSMEIATRIIHAYYSRAETAANYIKKVLRAAKKNGYVSTYYGRRRYCPEYANSNGDTHEIEKTLWNHVNAGTAAEFLKFKQVKVWDALRQAGFSPDQVRLSINLYDQTIWRVRDDLLEDVRSIAESIWHEREPGFLKFRTEVKVGKTWRECSK